MFLSIFPQKDSPLGCATLKKSENVKIVGCRTNVNKVGVNPQVMKTTIESTTRIIMSTTVKIFSTKIRVPKPALRKSTPLPSVTSYDAYDNSTDMNVTTPNPQMGEADSVPVVTLTVALPSSFIFLGGCFLYVQYRRGRGFIYGCLNRRRRYQTSPPPSPANSTQSMASTVLNMSGENTLFQRAVGGGTSVSDTNSLQYELPIENLGPNSNAVYSVA